MGSGGQVYQAEDTTHARGSRSGDEQGQRERESERQEQDRKPDCGWRKWPTRTTAGEAMLEQAARKRQRQKRHVRSECQKTSTGSMRGAAVIRPKAHWERRATHHRKTPLCLVFSPFAAAGCRDRDCSRRGRLGSSALQGRQHPGSMSSRGLQSGWARTRVESGWAKGLPRLARPRSSSLLPPPPSISRRVEPGCQCAFDVDDP